LEFVVKLSDVNRIALARFQSDGSENTRAIWFQEAHLIDYVSEIIEDVGSPQDKYLLHVLELYTISNIVVFALIAYDDVVEVLVPQVKIYHAIKRESSYL